MTENDFELVRGSGNVFRDFNDPHADLKQAKAILAARIIAVLDKRSLTVRKAATLTGFAAADFSRIRNADLGRFTLDRLIKMLAALDSSIRVTVHVASEPSERREMTNSCWLRSVILSNRGGSPRSPKGPVYDARPCTSPFRQTAILGCPH